MSDHLAKQLCLFLFVFLWLTYSLINWDIENLRDLMLHDGSPLYMQKLWNLAFSLMATYLWWATYIFLFFLVRQESKITIYLKWSLIIIYGPNLLFWNVIGSMNESIHLSIPMTLISWSLLYSVSFALTGYLVSKFFKVFSTAFKNCTDQRNLRKKLINSVCSICIENFQSIDNVQMLPICRHLFHVQCIQMWMNDHPSCPVCRQVYY